MTKFLIIENKNTEHLTPTLHRIGNRAGRKNRKYRKTKDCFEKESVENTDLTKSVLNKIMTTTKLCVKYNFVVPLGFCTFWNELINSGYFRLFMI